MKKIILITNIILPLIIGGFIFLNIPITKLSTKNAMQAIEGNFLKKDLNMDEQKQYEFVKRHILWNQSASDKCSRNAWLAGLLVCFVLVLNNLYILLLNKRLKTPKP